MKRALLTVAGALLFGTAASAAVITYTAALGNFENPPTGSPGTGFASITVDSVANTMLVNVTFSGLTSGVTASHIPSQHPTFTVASPWVKMPAWPPPLLRSLVSPMA